MVSLPSFAGRAGPFVAATALIAVVLAATTPVAAPVAAQIPVDQIYDSCGSSNPYFVTTCFARGGNQDEPALVAFRDTPENPDSDMSDHIVLAYARDIGSAFGLAHHHGERALLIAALHKRGSAFGPNGGPGSIYRLDMNTGSVSTWHEVPNAGNDTHEPDDNYFPDNGARNGVGVIGLGGLALSDDGSEVFVMNLLGRQIHRLRYSDKALLGQIEVGSAGETWANDARPFAVKVWRGKLYHGVVRSGYRSQDEDEIEALVYESDPDGGNMRVVNRFPLAYDRGNIVANSSARWRPWKDGYSTLTPGAQLGAYPQPMLTDIEFGENGDMYVGLRDRNGDMTFFDPGGRNPPGEGTGIPGGDTVMSRYNGDTWDTTTVPEFFFEDNGPLRGQFRGTHQETGFGGLAIVHGANLLVATGLAPIDASTGGAYWFNTEDGTTARRETLYDFESQVNFGKANGLGDVEGFCVPAQPTATPTEPETATPTETEAPSATPTLTVVPPTVTATATVPSATVPAPTVTPTVPTPTAPPTTGSTPSERREETDVPPPPPTPVLPGLPQTGMGPGEGGGVLAVALISLAAVAAGGLVWRRRRLVAAR
jgi:hypothetical protein